MVKLVMGGAGLGIIVIALGIWFCGRDPRRFFQQNSSDQIPVEQPTEKPASLEEKEEFAHLVLDSTSEVWGRILPEQAHRRYNAPKLVFYSSQISSPCIDITVPQVFYCPTDQKLYIDFAFLDLFGNEFNKPGAQAYVIAHEVGHHVQELMGRLAKVERKVQNHPLKIASELQADCYAGVWCFYARQNGIIQPVNAEEALHAASELGDDIRQKSNQREVVPESFTHGSAQQRVEWFSKGFQTGQFNQCQIRR